MSTQTEGSQHIIPISSRPTSESELHPETSPVYQVSVFTRIVSRRMSGNLTSFVLALLLLSVTPDTVVCGERISSTKVHLMRGSGYAEANDSGEGWGEIAAETLEVSHVRTWLYGDFYLKNEIFRISNTNLRRKIIIQPRVSIFKMSNLGSLPVLRDSLLSIGYAQSGESPIYKYGLGLDLAVPFFNYFMINWLVRDDTAIPGNTSEYSCVWDIDILGDFYGYGDVTISQKEGTIEYFSDKSVEGNASLMYPVTQNFSVGIRYHSFRNKHGDSGRHESLPVSILDLTL